MYEYLENNILLLKYAGLWVTGNYFEKKLYNFYSLIVSIFFIFLDTFLMFLNIRTISDNLERSSSYLTILCIKIMGCTKLIMLIKKKDTVDTVMHSLNSSVFRWRNERHQKIMRNSFHSHAIAFKGFSSMGIFSCMLYITLPLIMKQQKMLPFDSWYPFDSKVTHWYIIAYAHQVLSTTYITLCNVGIDTFSAGLMTVVSCQCAILGDTIMNLDEHNLDFEEFFREIAEHHGQILQLSKKLNDLFSFYSFAQMSLCVLLFCTALFRLSVIEPMSPEFLTVIVFISSIGIQLFLYCWFGNEVTVQSSKLHLAAFHCSWVGSPISFQKKLILFMRRTADPIKMRALHFFPMSILSFSIIMKNSWSYFAVLQQIHKRM